MNFVNSVVEKAKDNKDVLIKIGSTVAGALVGLVVGNLVTAESDDIFLEQMVEDLPEMPE